MTVWWHCWTLSVVVGVTLIWAFWQGSEQKDLMMSLSSLQISSSFIFRPPWSQLPTGMYEYTSPPVCLKFMISYLKRVNTAVNEYLHKFNISSLDRRVTCQVSPHSGQSEWSPPIRRWSWFSSGSPAACVRLWDACFHTNPEEKRPELKPSSSSLK